MKEKKLFLAMRNIDEELISEAADYTPQKNTKSQAQDAEVYVSPVRIGKTKYRWKYPVTAAALLGVTVCALVAVNYNKDGIMSYHHSAPVNTNGENPVTPPEDTAPQYTYAFSAEGYETEQNGSSNQKVYKWVCSWYENGAFYYEYKCFDSMPDYLVADEEAKLNAFESMSEAERELWENRLDIEMVSFYVNQERFISLHEFYHSLVTMNANYMDDYEMTFYKNEEDCRNGKQVTSDDVDDVEEGMILKVYPYESSQAKHPDEPPSPDDVPYILHDIGIFESTTVGELKDRLYFIDREDIKIYEIILVDINSDPPSTRISELTDDGENFKDAYGIYIEYTYLGEAHALDFYAVDYYPNSSIRRIFQWGEVSAKELIKQ